MDVLCDKCNSAPARVTGTKQKFKMNYSLFGGNTYIAQLFA